MEAVDTMTTVMLWVVVPIMAIVFLGFKAEGIPHTDVWRLRMHG
jgi:hypothetical protein